MPVKFLSLIRVKETSQQPSQRLKWDLECELRELASPEFCPGQGLA